MKIREILGQKQAQRSNKLLQILDPLSKEHNLEPFKLVESSALLGLEVEAEGFSQVRFEKFSQVLNFRWLFANKPDGSLRDNGIEFVSHILSAKDMTVALFLIDLLNKETKLEYNARTGIHVHVNVKEFTIEQIKTFIALYTLFENSLFKISGDRQDSIFCVPIRISKQDSYQLYSNGPDGFHGMLASANKYMALNYLPIRTFGTMEFRHMQGTNNVFKVAVWINVILTLYNFAQKTPFETIKDRIFALNTNSLYTTFGREVFGDMYKFILPAITEPFFIKDVEQGVAILKEWHINTSEYKKVLKDGKKNTPLFKPVFKPMPKIVVDDVELIPLDGYWGTLVWRHFVAGNGNQLINQVKNWLIKENTVRADLGLKRYELSKNLIIDVASDLGWNKADVHFEPF